MVASCGKKKISTLLKITLRAVSSIQLLTAVAVVQRVPPLRVPSCRKKLAAVRRRFFAVRDSETAKWKPGTGSCDLRTPPGRLLLLSCSGILFICPSGYFSHKRSSPFHAEAYVPTEPAPPLKDARVSQPDEDQERARGTGASARQGTQAGLGQTGLPGVNRRLGQCARCPGAG